MNIAQLERDFAAKKAEGATLLKKTLEACRAENDRLMTDDERTAIQAITDEAKGLDTKLTRAKGDDAFIAEVNRLTAGAATAAVDRASASRPTRYQSLGEQWTSDADVMDFFKAQRHRTQSTWRSPSKEVFDHAYTGGMGLRAATLTEDPASGGALIQPQVLPGIQPLPTPRLVVADLIAPGTTDSNAVTYMREKVFTNAAAAVLEGAVKPESTLTFEAITDPVRKIAHWLPVTEEMLEDVAQIRSYIDARLRLGVQIEEEDQLLNGTGVAPELLGLRIVPGLAPDVARAAAEPSADAILRQIMAIYNSSLMMPDGIVMNPTDWGTVLLTKGGQGQYLTAGPFQPIQTTTLWGLPTVTTPKIEQGVALVGAYRQAAQVFRKGGMRLEASNSHADYFIKNLVAIRAEERLALAIYRPGAFGEVTGLGPVVTVP